MLKAQLGAKISQLDPKWRDKEDLLTGDFFGVLDYLPRVPFLSGFLSRVAGLQTSGCGLPLDNVDWERVELHFWKMTHTGDEDTEPDVIFVTNRWVLVVEVKLDSGLGVDQAWREYCVGKDVAVDRRLPPESVYYLLLTKKRLSPGSTFRQLQRSQREELLSRTLFLRWCQAAALIDSWLRDGVEGQPLRADQERMLGDLLEAMRKRRALVFSDFAFENQPSVQRPEGGLFWLSLFEGFMAKPTAVVASEGESVFLRRFGGFLRGPRQTVCQQKGNLLIRSSTGFLTRCPAVAAPEGAVFLPPDFTGFQARFRRVERCLGVLFAPSVFTGFLRSAPRCRAASARWI